MRLWHAAQSVIRVLLDQLSTQPQIVCTPTHRERLGNTVYRGTCSDANQRTSI